MHPAEHENAIYINTRDAIYKCRKVCACPAGVRLYLAGGGVLELPLEQVYGAVDVTVVPKPVIPPGARPHHKLKYPLDKT